MKFAGHFGILLLALVFTLGCHTDSETGKTSAGFEEPPVIQFSPKELLQFQAMNPFLQARKWIEAGDLKMLNHEMKNLLEINTRGAMGKGLLHYAALKGDTRITHLLLTARADPNIEDVFERTPLHYAASAGHQEVVNLLIESGASVLSVTRENFSVLHAAAAGGLPQLATLCMNKGIDVNMKYADSYSPLYYAINRGRSRVISVLLAAGADVYSSNSIAMAAAHMGNTSILRKIFTGPQKEKISAINKNIFLHTAGRGGHLPAVTFLLRHGADILSANPQKTAENFLYSAIRSGNIKMVQLALNKGIHMNGNGKRQHTPSIQLPIHLAILKGKREMIDYLLKMGAHITYDLNTLSLAIRGGYLPLVKKCLKQGVSLKRVFEQNTTLHHQVALAGHLELIPFLIQRGVDVNGQDREGKTLLHHAAYHQNRHMIDQLLRYGADIDVQDRKGETPLFSTITYQHTEMIQFLLSKGANPAIPDNQLNTPLIKAVRLGLQQIAMFILEKRPNIAGNTATGYNLLHAAVIGNWPQLVEFLIVNKKMNVNGTSKHGITPLHLAARGGSEDFVRLLLKLGANKAARDFQNRTPADYLDVNARPSLKALLQ